MDAGVGAALMGAPVYVLGGHQTDFAHNYSRAGEGLFEMLGAAVRGALEDGHVAPEAVEVAHVGNFTGELFAGQGHLGGFDAQGRVVAVEVLVMTGTARESIKSPDNNLPLKDVMERSVHPYGMQTFDIALKELVKGGLVDVETARAAMG